MDVLVDRRAHDLRRGETDALVDGLHPEVAGADRHLLGAVAVPVEAGLADEAAMTATQPVTFSTALRTHGTLARLLTTG